MRTKLLLLFVLAFGLNVSAWGQAAYRVEPFGLYLPTNTANYGLGTGYNLDFGIPTADGGMLTGTWIGYTTAIQNYSYSTLITKIKADGEVEWSNIYHNSQVNMETIHFYDAVEKPGDGYLLVGHYQENSPTSLPAGGAAIAILIDEMGIQQSGALLYDTQGNDDYVRAHEGILTQNGDFMIFGVKDNQQGQNNYAARFTGGNNYQGSWIETNQAYTYHDVTATQGDECAAVSSAGKRVFLTYRTNDCQDIAWQTAFQFTSANNFFVWDPVISFDPQTGGFFLAGAHSNGLNWIAYADPNGQFQWVKSIFGGGTDNIIKDIVVYDGRAYAVGATYYSSSGASAKGFLLEIDNQGQIGYFDHLDHSNLPNEQNLPHSIEIAYDPQQPGNPLGFFISGVSRDNWQGAFDHIAAHMTEIGTSDDNCSVSSMNYSVFGHSYTQIPAYPQQIYTDDYHNFELDVEAWTDFKYNNCGNFKKPYSQPTPEAAGFGAYPNPSSGRVTFEVPAEQLPAHFSLRDLQGREVRTGMLNRNFTETQLDELPAALYQLSIQGQTEHFSQKLILSK